MDTDKQAHQLKNGRENQNYLNLDENGIKQHDNDTKLNCLFKFVTPMFSYK